MGGTTTLRRAALLAILLATAVAGAAEAANRNDVSRAQVTPGGKGSNARPLAVQVRFGLRSRAEDATNRPQPTRTYVLGLEGIVAFAERFPSCPIRELKRRRPPARCDRAEVGGGLVKGAAGIAEDELLESSVPCNLRMRVYNIRSGLGLRLDGEPPLPPSFASNRIGCPVAIHTAIAAPFRRVTIDGVRSTQIRFNVPPLLLEPLEGWNGALQLVDITLERRSASAGGRSVGFFSAVGCGGAERTAQVTFVGLDGSRSEATGSTGC